MKKVAGEYLLGGITLVSEIALPELPLIQRDSATPHPANILWGEVADNLPGAVMVDPDCFATPSQCLIRVPGVAHYLITNGREVMVRPDADALPLDVRGYLLGAIFVVLCQQRGLIPLHDSAVGSGEGVVAFLAGSGQGKSSLAAHLAQRGFPVLADDICLIDPAPSERTTVIPTAPWLKLWRNSLENLGRHAEGLERVFSDDEKFRVPLASALKPQPISKLIFLEGGETSTVTEIEEVSAVAAVPLLMNLTHQAYLLQATGQREESFLRCSRVSSHAKSYRLHRPWGLEHLESTVDALEQFLLREK
jgi:hypothetical protein